MTKAQENVGHERKLLSMPYMDASINIDSKTEDSGQRDGRNSERFGSFSVFSGVCEVSLW